MKYVITGAAGFIGYHTCKALLEQGHSVVGVDIVGEGDENIKVTPEWPSYGPTRKYLLTRHQNFSYHHKDIRSATALNYCSQSCWNGADAVIHLAAMPGVRASFQNPAKCCEVNITGTVNVLEACRRQGIKNVVIASSSSVYGDNPTPFRETQQCDNPKSVYAAAKRSIELIAHAYASQYGMNITCLRFFTVFGEYGRQDMLPDKAIKALYRGKPITIFGDGTQIRDFTHVDNIVDGIIMAANEPNGYRIINLGAANPMTVREFIRQTADTMGVEPILEYADADKADATATWASIGKARGLGWTQATSTADGIEQTCKWFGEYVKGQQLIPDSGVELADNPSDSLTQDRKGSNKENQDQQTSTYDVDGVDQEPEHWGTSRV